jgi:hypothetical protein
MGKKKGKGEETRGTLVGLYVHDPLVLNWRPGDITIEVTRGGNLVRLVENNMRSVMYTTAKGIKVR